MKFLLSAFLSACSLFAFSQTIKSTIVEDPKQIQHTVKWAFLETTEYSDGDNMIRIESNRDNNHQLGYVAKMSTIKHNIILHKFDANRVEIVTNKLENNQNVFGPIQTKSAEFGHRLLLFYFRYDDKDSLRLYVSEINRKSLELVNTQFLYSYQQDNVGLFKIGKATQHNPLVRISPDSSKLLLAYQNIRGELYTAVFGDQCNLLRQGVFKNNVLAENDVTDAVIENSGNDELVVSLPKNPFSTLPLKGIIIQNLDKKEKYQEFGEGNPGGALVNCHISCAKDNSKVYVFGDYAGENASAGSWLAEIVSQNLKVGRPSLFPYPDDLKEKVYKIGFGVKRHGNFDILDINYNLVEFENGSLALCGHPVYREDRRSSGFTSSVSMHRGAGNEIPFAGPIIAAFFDKGRIGKNYAMIPRNENLCEGSEGIYLPYQDKLVVIYNDYKKNIEGEILDHGVHQSGWSYIKELSLAYAIINKTGTIQERKLISEGVSRMNFYVTTQYRKTGQNSLYIPSYSDDKKVDAYRVAMITME
jgi:hypothetical protein